MGTGGLGFARFINVCSLRGDFNFNDDGLCDAGRAFARKNTGAVKIFEAPVAERKNQLSVFAAAVFIFLAGAARTGIIAADLGSGAAYGFVRQIELGDFNYALHHF